MRNYLIICFWLLGMAAASQDLKALKDKAFAAYESNNIDEAIRLYRQGIGIAPKDATIHNNLGWMLYLKDDYKTSLIHLHQANRLEANDDQTLRNLAQVYYTTDKLDSALFFVNQAIKINNEDGFAYFLKGKVLIEQEDYANAIKELNTAAQLEPNGAGIYEKRGWAKMNLEDYEEAIKDFNMLIKLAPDYHIGYNNRGYSFAMLKKYAEALPDFDKAIALQPKYATAYNNRAYSHFHLGKKDEACKGWKQAQEMGNKDAEYFLDSYCKATEMSINGQRVSQGQKITLSQNTKKPNLLVSGVKPRSTIKINAIQSKGTNLIVFKSSSSSNSSFSTTTNAQGKADISLVNLFDKKGNYQIHIEYVDLEGKEKELDCIVKWK